MPTSRADRPRRSSSFAATVAGRALGSRQLGILLFLVLEVVYLASQTSAFLTEGNLANVASDLTWIAVMGVGEALVIMTGGVDLSVGSILGFASVVAAMMAARGAHVALIIGAGLLAGLLVGAVNGAFVAWLRLPSFIVTLATLSIGRGLAVWITGSATITGLSSSFTALGGSVGRVPIPTLVMLVVVILGWLLVRGVRWGRYILAIGGNESAARLSGVPVAATKMLVYSLSGLLAGLAGVLFAAKFGVGQSTAGFGYELDVVAAVVIGGTSLAGGQGSIPGALLGAVVMGVLRNGLVLLGVQEQWTYLTTGGVILVASVVDALTNKSAVE
jgi:ribose transport system permease protein